MRGYFAAGFDIGISTAKLAQAMVEVLSQLPPEATLSKEAVVRHLGLLGQIAKTRDVNAAWNRAKHSTSARIMRACPQGDPPERSGTENSSVERDHEQCHYIFLAGNILM